MSLFGRSPRPLIAAESKWLTMRDGVRLAIDVMRPGGLPEGERLPTVLVMTCYWRSFQLCMPDPSSKAYLGPRASWADEFLKHNYAVVVVDSRGTGTSEGIYCYPFSADELADYRKVAELVVTQPWPNGKVGAMGHSYEGTTAMLLAASGYSAVRVVIPREFEFGLYTDLVRPGGVFNRAFLISWSENKVSMDSNRIPKLFGWLAGFFIKALDQWTRIKTGRNWRESLVRVPIRTYLNHLTMSKTATTDMASKPSPSMT